MSYHFVEVEKEGLPDKPDYLCGGNLPEDYWDETLCKRCWEKYLFKVMNE